MTETNPNAYLTLHTTLKVGGVPDSVYNQIVGIAANSKDAAEALAALQEATESLDPRIAYYVSQNVGTILAERSLYQHG